MKNKERVFRICKLSIVLVLLFLSFTGCAEKGKDDVFQEHVSLINEKSQNNLEQLKLERDRIMKKIKETEALKSINSTVPEAEKKEDLKKLEVLSEDLLRHSKEIEEKIKALQDNKN